MPRGKPIGPKEADQALRLVAEGKTWREIATIVGVSATGIAKALKETWPDELEEARERKADLVRNRVWDMGMAGDTESPSTRWALDHLVKWHLPEAKETQTVNVTGGLEVNHPDVAAAIERFTARVVSLATGQREGIAHSLAAGPSEGGPRVPVAELDRPPEPGGTDK